MASATKLNRAEFDRTWRQYREVCKRDLASSINTKLFFIARRAVLETPRSDPAKIRQLKARAIVGTGTNYKSGKTKSVTVRAGIESTRAARIIMASRRSAGLPPLTKQELSQSVRKMITARLSSRAYLASGYLPGIRILQPHADARGAPRKDQQAKAKGRAKGSARPARSTFGLLIQAGNISNAIGTVGKNQTANKALWKHSQPALQRAYDYEVASMKQYIERKLQTSARRSGIRTA